MSGVCYPTKISMKFLSEKNVMEPTKKSHELNENKSVDKILEYEAVVSTAESKCAQLKDQIDRIKQLYQSVNDTTKIPTNKNHDLLRQRTAASLKSFSNKTNALGLPIKKLRQNSQVIKTDTSGGHRETINNIFVGITKPIQLQNLEKPSTQSCEIANPNVIETENTPSGVAEVKINTKSKQSIRKPSTTKFSTKPCKSRVTTKTSSGIIKKPKKLSLKTAEKSNTNTKASTSHLTKAIPVSVPLVNKRSRKFQIKPSTVQNFMKSTDLNKVAKTGDLVEIYHNNAVKESKSSESDLTKKKFPPKPERAKTDLTVVPPLSITEKYCHSEEPKGVVSCVYKNYTLPTISSRMKRAAKCYMHSFNIKSIPFCLSTSTSPSHNIGINIQQVMNMAKTRQINNKLSPTLAYNIGLAAGRKDENPLSYLISSLTPSTFNPQCPLTRNSINYQHLQEVAKSIPQETIEEKEENEDDISADTQSVIITGPSGDVKVKNQRPTIWTADGEEKRCTCVINKGITFQQLVNKFNGTNKNKLNTPGKIKDLIMDNKQVVDFLPIQNKEKKLKEVLGKLHDEFEQMNKKYDELVKKTQDDPANAEVLKELEILDKQLNSKEEEIIMVMSLYKEVLALKQQVKSLKDRTSKENLSIKNQPKINYSNNIITAKLLNTLLQRVQHFQTHYKPQ